MTSTPDPDGFINDRDSRFYDGLHGAELEANLTIPTGYLSSILPHLRETGGRVLFPTPVTDDDLDHVPADGPGFAEFIEERTTQAANHVARCHDERCEFCHG